MNYRKCRFCLLVLPFWQRIKSKTCYWYCIYRFQYTKLYPFQLSLSLWFILATFLKFRKFQPRYVIKYILIKKRVGNRHLDSADLSHPNSFRNVYFKLVLLLFCYRWCFARLGLPIHARILDGKAYSTPIPLILAQSQWHWVPCGRFSYPCTWWNKGYKEMGTKTRCLIAFINCLPGPLLGDVGTLL